MLSLFTVASGAAAWAQSTVTNNLIPIVTVQATQPIATATNSGVFTVFRAGNTNATLNVWYDLDGSASNGVDYGLIPPHIVEIPAGATANTIVIQPLTNPSPTSAAKTVALTLTNSPLMNPVNYEIGSPSSASVYIESGAATNLPPVVAISSPTNGQTFTAPANIPILAPAYDPDGRVETVAFYENSQLLGVFTNPPPPPPGSEIPLVIPRFLWTNVAAGDYALTAVATDDGDLSATSAPVNISVLTGPPPTNQPPVVRIGPPTNGATFFAAVDVPIFATASASSGTASVEFFADGQDLGPGALEDCVMPLGSCVGCPPPVLTCTYFVVWSNAPVGAHVLTALATDNNGLSTTSAPVNIAVLQGSPTNTPPEVRIISPANGAVFLAPINLPLFAFFTYPHAPFDWGAVGFYDGTNFLGLAHPVSMPPTALATNIYELVWSNAPVGNHVLTAQADGGTLLDNAIWSIVSAPVNLTILPPPPPPTNRPPIVSIVATDPVAIEGAKSWVWPGETNATPTWAAWPTAVCRFFTNCGPKTATFAVRRFGATNDDLTVRYEIGGTASNGVNYVALPGFVTVPAGERRALITIVPTDDGPPDISTTVILALDPSTNTPPDYLLGLPLKAAALIIDPPGPVPPSGTLPDKCFHLAMPGPDAAWFYVQCTTDLVNWTTLCTNQVINGSIDFIDTDAAGNPSRFYRAVPLANPPSD